MPFLFRGFNDPLVLKWMPRLKGIVDLKYIFCVFLFAVEYLQTYFVECLSSSFPMKKNGSCQLSKNDKNVLHEFVHNNSSVLKAYDYIGYSHRLFVIGSRISF